MLFKVSVAEMGMVEYTHFMWCL